MMDIHYQNIIIHAPNIHQGGGMISLMSLLAKLKPTQIAVINIDARADLSELGHYRVNRINPSILSRLSAEHKLLEQAKTADCVICLGNLPPLFSLSCYTIVYIQNRLLVDPSAIRLFSFKIRLRLMLERLWQTVFMHNVDEIWVQTPSMQRLVHEQFPQIAIQTNTLMLLPEQKPVPVEPTYDFIYVASLLPHKNHHNLIKAWISLSQQDIKPSLLLICNDDNPELSRWIHEQMKTHDLKITFQHEMPHHDIFDAYAQARALIYPSLIESYGMPLVEAAHVGIAILAPDLDYVHDLIKPAGTFDPEKYEDIARAVTIFLESSR